jgi:hypothetical protein
MTQAICRRPVTARSGFDPKSVPVRFVGQVFFKNCSVFPASIIPSVLNTHLYFLYMFFVPKNEKTRRGNLPKSHIISEIGNNWIQKYFHFLFFILNCLLKSVLYLFTLIQLFTLLYLHKGSTKWITSYSLYGLQCFLPSDRA